MPTRELKNSEAQNPAAQNADTWPPALRAVVSMALAVYLFILLLGPLTNPVASEHLTGPLARAFAPVHRVLFQGHGYRFFAPEPGPGHFVEARLTDSKGDVLEVIRFPDRDRHRPRLRYHRWFMLAETLFNDLDSTPHPDAFAEAQAEMQTEIDRRQASGQLKPARRLRTQKQQLETEYEKARQRVETLVRSVATGILQDSPDADAIELVLFERSIPLPQDVVDGSRLTDPRYLSDPLPIGKFTRSELSADKTFTNAAGQGRADAMEELP